MLSILSERQNAIVETITMRLHVKQALLYLKDAGFEMGESTYFRQKKKVQNMKLERMHYIAKYFPDQHLERIDKCDLVEKLMWENYHAEKDPTKRVKILESIINIQPYLSSYYEATKNILESTIGTNNREQKPNDWDNKPLEVGFESEEWAHSKSDTGNGNGNDYAPINQATFSNSSVKTGFNSEQSIIETEPRQKAPNDVIDIDIRP